MKDNQGAVGGEPTAQVGMLGKAEAGQCCKPKLRPEFDTTTKPSAQKQLLMDGIRQSASDLAQKIMDTRMILEDQSGGVSLQAQEYFKEALKFNEAASMFGVKAVVYA